MRTSLIEAEQIENFLLHKGEISERLVTEAKVLTSPELRERVQYQKDTYALIHIYGREKLYAEIQRVEQKMFSNSRFKNFQNLIKSIFK